MKLHRIIAVAQKEWREIVRDRMFFALAFVLPVVWMLVFGYGMTLDVQNIPFAVIDYDHSAMSRDYAHHFIASRYFDFKGYLASPREADQLLAKGSLRLIIVIPEHFEQDLTAGRHAQVGTLLDGTFANRTQTVQGYVEAVNRSISDGLRARRIAQRLGIPLERAQYLAQPVHIELRYLYNQALRSIWSIAPSLLMFTLMLVPPMLTALVVVREKESGAIYNIYVSTVSRGEFLAGKLLPGVAISFADAIVLWLLAVYYFGAPFKGSVWFFLLATLVYVICTCSIGLFVSTLVRTQNAALMITTILAIIPAIQFSGMLTPISTLGGAAYIQAHLFPAMYYEDVVMGVFLKGVGWDVLWQKLAVLAGYSAILIAASYLGFRKRQRT